MNQSVEKAAEEKIVDTQFGIAHSADLEERTWTFLMPDEFKVWAGKFAIVDLKKYEQLITAEALAGSEAKGDDGWISVEIDTPKVWGDYLVTSGNWVGSCHYDGKFYDYSVSKMRPESRYEIPVTHWQPLPSPPKTKQ